MKREGHQHGVVSCYRMHPGSLSRQRFVKMVDSASATGLFAKVPTKPTNQSKFTGKCRKPRCNSCHLHPVSKSKAKAKGAMKLRSIDPENEMTKYCFGASATGVLAYLADGDGGGGYSNDDYDNEDRVEDNYSYSNDYGYDFDDDHCHDQNDDDDISHDHDQEHENDVDVCETDDDDTMSFCDVELCWGDEDGNEYGNEVEDGDGWMVLGGWANAKLQFF